MPKLYSGEIQVNVPRGHRAVVSQMDFLAMPGSSGAVLSQCRRYRYELWRRWSDGPWVAFVMLNPSTADEHEDDSTIRRCVGFAKSFGGGGLLVGNLFAWRATDPKALKIADDPIGPSNDDHLLNIARRAGKVICAWGAHGTLQRRGQEVFELIQRVRVDAEVLDLTRSGQPRHPLYLPADSKPFDPYEHIAWTEGFPA